MKPVSFSDWDGFSDTSNTITVNSQAIQGVFDNDGIWWDDTEQE